jgi:hypothetical protein
MSDKDNGEDSVEGAMQDMIGKQLRTLYDSVLAEPIPDRIVDLLMQLDEVSEPQERSAAFENSVTEPDNDNRTERQ